MADLAKFGVPIDGRNQGLLHPKQQYRFRVIFKNFGLNTSEKEMTANVVSATRPTYTDEVIQVHSYNSRAYIRGKHEWQSVTVTLRDDINNSVIASVGSQIQRQMNHYEQTSAVAGINYKFACEIHSLDGTTGDELESWDLDGCFLEQVVYPEGNYESGEVNTLELTIRYDNATNVKGKNTNQGNVVGDDPMIDLPSGRGGATVN